MATLIGGFDTGLLDSSLYLLNRTDRTREGQAGHGEETYVNVSNGNLLVRHVDAYLPSQGEDYALMRTYNSRGSWNDNSGQGWVLSNVKLDLSHVNNNYAILINADSSQFRFDKDANGVYRSVDGVGAYEEIRYDSKSKTYTLLRSDQSRLIFSNNGTLLGSIDAAGNTIDYSYKGGKLIRVQDDTGHSISYLYTGSDLTSIRDDETGEILVTYGYAQGLLTRVTDREGHVTRYYYGGGGELYAIVLPYDSAKGEAGRQLTFEYELDVTDNTGKSRLLSRLYDAEGNATDFSYSIERDNHTQHYIGGETRVINALGVKRSSSNDAEYLQWRLENGYYGEWDPKNYTGWFLDPDTGLYVEDQVKGEIYRTQYDEIRSHYTTTYQYDANGAITSVKNAKLVAGAVVYDYETQYLYDDKENLIAIIDANGYAITHSDDPYWRALRQDYGYTDPTSGEGKLVSELSADEIAALTELYTSHFAYDSRGNMIERRDNEGNLTTFSYTSFNKLKSEIVAMGHALATSNTNLYQEKRVELGYAADVASLSQADKDALLALYTTTYTYYDDLSQVERDAIKAANPDVAIDDLQDLYQITTPGGDISRFYYDDFGNVLRRITYLDANDLDTPATQQLTQFFYDVYGNNIKTIEANAWASTHSNEAYWLQLRAEFGYIDPATGEGLLAPQDPSQIGQPGYLTQVQIDELIGRYTSTNTFDHFGNRTIFTDGNGNTTTYTYDKDNRLTSVIDPIANALATLDSAAIRAERVARGYAEYVADLSAADKAALRASYSTLFFYDSVGNRIEMRDAAGHSVFLVYDRNNMLLSVIDPAIDNPAETRTTLYEYDVVGNGTAIIDAEERRTTYVYREDNRRIEIITPEVEGPDGLLRSYSTSFAYDGVGNRITVNDNNGNVTQLVYNQNGLVKQVTEPIGNVSQYRYDANYNQIQIIIGAQLAEAQRRILQFSYDEEDQLIVEIDAEGGITRHAYNAVGDRIRITDANGEAIVSSDEDYWVERRKDYGIVDAGGNGKLVADLTANDIAILKEHYTYEFEFDAQRRLIREIRPEVIDPKTGLGRRYTIEHYFDGNANEIATTDENGNTSRFTFDKDDRLVMMQDANLIKTVFTYDSRHNRTGVYIGIEAQADENGHVLIEDIEGGRATTFQYNEFNEIVAKTDGVGNALVSSDSDLYRAMRARFGYTDANGQGKLVADLTELEKASLKALYTERYTHDRVGNRTTITDNLGNQSQFRYDALNRLASRIDALQQQTSYLYDGNSNRTSSTNPVGYALINSNDSYYQKLRIQLGYAADAALLSDNDKAALLDLYTTRFTYDGNNRLIDSIDPQGIITRREYDNVGNVIGETRAINTADARRVSYEYDLNNRQLAQHIDPDDLDLTTRYDYDAVGNRLAVTDARGHTTRLVYDALNRNIKIIDPLSFETRIEFDGVGNRLSLIDARGGITRFQYDPGNRQIEITDAEGRVRSFRYDSRGNRIEMRTAVGTADEELTTYEYDAENNLRRVLDAENNVTTHDYDQVHSRIATLDGNGNTTSYSFDAVKQMLELIDAEGNRSTFAYDATGNRITITDANGHAITSSDEPYYLQLRAELGYTDANGNPLLVAELTQSQIEALLEAYTSHLEYDNKQQLIRQIDADGVATTYHYDAVSNRIDLIRAADTDEAQHTQFAYDKADRLISTTDAIGMGLIESDAPEYLERRKSLGYVDGAGNGLLVADLTTAQIAALQEAYSSHNEYDENGNVVRSLDALDRVTEYVYDPLNRVTHIIDPIGTGLAESDSAVYQAMRIEAGYPALVADLSAADIVALKAAHSIEYRYDAVSNRTQVIDALGRTTTSYYNLNQEITYTVDAEGGVIRFEYDNNGNRIKLTRYVDPLAGDADPDIPPLVDENAEGNQITRFAYDKLNRLVRSLDAEGYVIDSRYDGVGNVTSTTAYANAVVYDSAIDLLDHIPTADANDRLNQFIYDANSRLSELTDAEGYVSRNVYDAVGNQISQTLYLDKIDRTDPAKQQTVSMRYDAMNRVVSQISPLEIETTYTYDAVGNQTQVTEAANTLLARSFDYIYDDVNQLVEEINPELTRTRHVYDAAGQMVEHYQAYGLPEQRLTQNVFDGNGRIIETTHPDSTITRFDYDAVGNLERRIDAADSTDERASVFVYDKLNRVLDETLAVGTAAAISKRYAYDAFGNRTLEVIGYGSDDARSTDFVYDKNNRLIVQTDGNGISTLLDYDAYGNVIQRTTARLDIAGVPVGPTQTISMSYDGRDLQLTSENGANEIIRREYDAAGNLRFDTRASGTSDTSITEYRYDLGNRVTDKIVDPNGLNLATHYEYDVRNNLIVETDARGITSTTIYDIMNRAWQLTDALNFTTSYDYDVFGNQIAITTGQYLLTATDPGYDAEKAAITHVATTRYAYDAMDRQIFQVDGLGVVTKQEYDGRGNRIQKITAYAYLPANAPIDEASMQAFGSTGVPFPATDARVNQYLHDEADRIIAEIQPDGTVIQFSYTGAGESASKIVDYGATAENINATTLVFYDLGGRKTFEVDPVGSVSHFEYDNFGNVIRLTQGLAMGLDGQPSTEPTPDQRVTLFEYDGANRLVAEIVDPDGLALRTVFEYNKRGNEIAVIDANGYRGETVYDTADRVVWQRDAEGYIVAFAHDGNGNKTIETRYAEKGGSLPLGQLPPSSLDDQITRFAYDALNRVAEREDARGVTNRLQYDAAGNVLADIQNATELYGSPPRIKTFSYNLANLVIVQNDNVVGQNDDATGITLTTNFVYDGAYNLVTRTATNTWYDTLNLDANSDPTLRSEQQITKLTYDLNNRLTDEIMDPDGLAIHKSYRYDGLGNRIAEISPNGYAAISEDTLWAQNIRVELGVVDTTGAAIPAAQLSDSDKQTILNAFTTRTYVDAAGRQIYTVDPLGHVRQVIYDSVGNNIRAVQYANPVDITQLNDYTPPTVVPDSDNDRGVDYGYDKANRQISQTLDPVLVYILNADGEYEGIITQPTTTYVYDGVGNLIRETDGNGNTTYHYADSRGLKAGKIDAEGYLSLAEYDAFGNLVRDTLYLEAQVLSESEKANLDIGTYMPTGDSRVIEHSYDLRNNPLKTVFPPAELYKDGISSSERVEVDREFDAFGNVIKESVLHAVSDTAPAYKTLSYDAVGRIASETDARASEVLFKDDTYFVELRKELGYVNGAGEGKLAAELTEAEKAEIIASYSKVYRYDALSNIREQIEGGRETTFEYDRANRNTEVHYPAYDKVEVDADGNIVRDNGYRIIGRLEYDAFGNATRELKADGSDIYHSYDRANRKIASVDQHSVYTEYGYNFAGDRVHVQRYFTPVADPANASRPAASDKDQILQFDYDRLGRMIQETQLGDLSTVDDDRVTVIGYDANGNQVRTVGPRGNSATVLFDGLNRVIGTTNPSGGLTSTVYDALGNIVSQQAGGWAAPKIVDATVTQSFISTEGAFIQWQTDHDTNAIVYVRALNSNDAWISYGTPEVYSSLHGVLVNGLNPDSDYEYYVESQDLFGYTIRSDIKTFHTAIGVEGAVVSNLVSTVDGYTADLNFSLPGSPQNLEVIVGNLGSDSLDLENPVSFIPIVQPDGSYSVTLSFVDPDATLYQIRWTDAAGNQFATQPDVIQQQQELRTFDGTVSSTEITSGVYNMTVTWNLATELANGEIGSYVDDDTQETLYQIYIGHTPDDGSGQDPLYQEAVVVDGVATTVFENLGDRARILSLYYVNQEGRIVDAAPLPISTLVGLDERYQYLVVDFPDIDTEGTTLQFSYRLVGSDTWIPMPESSINGLSVDVLGLAEGDYEFTADLLDESVVLRTTGGLFSLREPGYVSNLLDSPQISNLSDSVNPSQPVNYTLEGTVLSFPDLLPVTTGQSIVLELTDDLGNTSTQPFNNATIDLATVPAGSYALRVVKSFDDGTNTTILNDITGDLLVQPEVNITQIDNVISFPDLLPLAAGDALSLEITDSNGVATSYPFDDASFDLTVLDPGDYQLHILKTHTETTQQPVLDANGDPVLDANGDPVTETVTTVTILNDISGDIVVLPLTLTDAESNNLSSVRNLISYNLTSQIDQNVSVTTLGENTSTDHVYTYYDGNGWKIFSNENNGVWTRYFYDGQGNVSREVRFIYQDPVTGEFVNQIQDLDERPPLDQLIANYDAAVLAASTGADTIREITSLYDAAGNKIQQTVHSQTYGAKTDEWQYDFLGNKTLEITTKGVENEENRSRFTYDAMGRATSVSFGPFQYFDSQGNAYYGETTQLLSYDGRGNRSTQINERGYTERFHYDAAGNLKAQWDAGKANAAGVVEFSGLRTEYDYDRFARMLVKREIDITDPNRVDKPTRVTEFQYDNFDQQIQHKNALGGITTTAYDKSGNKIAETNTNGHALTTDNSQWAQDTRASFGFERELADLTDDDKQALLNIFTERFFYDAENRVKQRIDRSGNVWRSSYDAYGEKVMETDPNGRVTRFILGPFGQVLGKTVTLTRTPIAVIEKDSRYDEILRQIEEGDSSGDGGFSGFIRRLILRSLLRRYASASYAILQGATSYTETSGFDWMGRNITTTDSFGKNIRFEFDDGDRLRALDDIATNQRSEYNYNISGNRITETLARDGIEIRNQEYFYNSRAWLTEVSTDFSYSNAGSDFAQTVNVSYRYDEVGNRVWVGANKFTYDGDNRMLFAYDGEKGETVDVIEYDGFGNRVRESRGASTITYIYDLNGRVTSSSAGDQWTYDPMGNALFHKKSTGEFSINEYNVDNQTIYTKNHPASGDDTESRLGYDAAGNVGAVRISSNDFGFDEVTYFDVRYKEQSKIVTNSWVKKAKGLRGSTSFTYNANSQLVFLDRGRAQKARENTVATFAYDNEGHIIARADKATALTQAGYFVEYNEDPDESYDEDSYGRWLTQTEVLQESWFYGATGGTTKLQSYVYGNGNPIAEGSTEHDLSIKTLTLQGGTPVTDSSDNVIGYRVRLIASDIVTDPNTGQIDRTATARNIAERVYLGFDTLSVEAQAQITSYIEGKLPPDDADIKDGASIIVAGWLQVVDGTYKNTKVNTDYSYRQVGGADGLPAGATLTHTVREGESLEAIASGYFGSPNYWYLIADANGLLGNEALTPGTTLIVPNVVANNVNNHETYKIYNESEIIGSKSPEIQVRKKKRSFFQKLIQIIIIIVIIVVAYYLITFAAAAFSTAAAGGGAAAAGGGAAAAGGGAAAAGGAAAGGAAAGGTVAAAGTSLGTFIGGLGLGTFGTLLVTTVAVGAIGYAVGFATSFATQGLAIITGLQDEFDWKAMRDMGKDFAISAVAAGLGAWASKLVQSPINQSLVKGVIEVGAQYIRNDGEINNVSGILLAMVPAKVDTNNLWGKSVSFINENKKTVSAGLSILEKSIRGDDITALDWANFAVAAIRGPNRGLGKYFDSQGLQWREIASQALVSVGVGLIVGEELGEDAALNFIGQSLGSLVTDVLTEEQLYRPWRQALNKGEISAEQFDSIVKDPNFNAEQKERALISTTANNKLLSLQEKLRLANQDKPAAPAPANDDPNENRQQQPASAQPAPKPQADVAQAIREAESQPSRLPGAAGNTAREIAAEPTAAALSPGEQRLAAIRAELSTTLNQFSAEWKSREDGRQAAWDELDFTDKVLVSIGSFFVNTAEGIEGAAQLIWAGLKAVWNNGPKIFEAAEKLIGFQAALAENIAKGDWDAVQGQLATAKDNLVDVGEFLGEKGKAMLNGMETMATLLQDDQTRELLGNFVKDIWDNTSDATKAFAVANILGEVLVAVGTAGIGTAAKSVGTAGKLGKLFSQLADALGNSKFAGIVRRTDRAVPDSASEPILFGQRRVSPNFGNDPRFPLTSGRSIDDVARDLADPSNPLSPDDLPITAFRDPGTGSLVSANTRTRAALARANLEPTKVDIVDLDTLSRRNRLELLGRLTENPIIENAPLPGPRVPVTPSMRDLTVLDIIEIR